MTGLDSIDEAIEDAENASGATEYSAWMAAAAVTALAHDRKRFLPGSLVRSFLKHCLNEAEDSTGRRLE